MKRCRKKERGGGLFSAIEHEQGVAAKTTGILELGESGRKLFDTFGRITNRLQDLTTGDTFIEGCLPKEGCCFKLLDTSARGYRLSISQDSHEKRTWRVGVLLSH